jgi:AraC-like DNA-binding protein
VHTPGQVHYGISTEGSVAWFIAVDPAWIIDSVKMTLMEGTIQNISVPVNTEESSLFKDCIQLLQVFDSQKTSSFDDQTTRSMLDVCLSLFVKEYQKIIWQFSSPNLRVAILTRQFRSLLLVSYRIMKSPSEYAASLNISSSYLNEAVKQNSGHPVSYWIHQELIMKAKRMLYYSDTTVKEIAYNLGYADPTYFIRLFTKVAGLSPMKFRQKHRR